MNSFIFEDIKIGLEKSFQANITASKVKSFIDISGDINPLHTDNEYATSKGFLGIVVHGMLTSSFYSTLVGMYLPGKYCILQGINIKFSKPVYIDDFLTITGTVSYTNEAYKRVEIKANITNQNNKKISQATIMVGVMHE